MASIRLTLLPAAVFVLLATGAGLFMSATGLQSAAYAQSLSRGPSGLPLPRFVTLKSQKVNVRHGPGQQYDVAWQFRRAGLPVEIVQEFDNWRRIRDATGDEGWVFHSLLSGERAAIVAPWAGKEELFAVRADNVEASGVIAYLEANVISQVVMCDGDWCRIRGKGYDGWLRQGDLWGVYPHERVGNP